MALTVLTIVHVIISLLAIFSGFVVVSGWIGGKNPPCLTKIFLATTVATSVTGFFFPFHGFTPAAAFGILSLIVLAAAIFAIYSRHLAGAWRNVFLINALVALYLNTFVLIAQSFQKIPTLQKIAPTQADPPFAIAQSALLILFIVLGFLSVRKFRPFVV